MLTNVSSNIFTGSKSINIKPIVSAEWNQNIFNPPYITVAGSGVKQTNITTGSTLTTVTGSSARQGFITKKFVMQADGNGIIYTVTPAASSPAFKVISYIKTNKPYPVMANIYGEGSTSQYGSTNAEISSLGWEKIELYVGGATPSDNIASFTYNITLNRFSTEDTFPIDILFTEPEVYPVTFFDYKYNSMYPTDSAFTNFRPGESYVNTGSNLFSFPSNFRAYNLSTGACSPVSSVAKNPSFFPVSSPAPYPYKNVLVSDISQYKYFISDTSNKSITGIYAGSGVMSNKLVIKFNTLSSIPSVNIAINGTNISVGGSQTISLATGAGKENNGVREEAGVLVLYWNGTGWTRTKWSSMPTISSNGTITSYVNINKITISYVSHTLRQEFSNMKTRMESASLNISDFNNDVARLQVIEISPRLELDLTTYLLDVSINKSTDNKSTPLPVSSMNSNDATISFSSIPLGNSAQPIPVFSNQSNYSGTVLKSMLNKNVKFYINFYLENYELNGTIFQPGTLIPGGIFYSDQWSENDANQVSVQCFDTTRYLQSTQVSDYVSNKQTVYEVISGLLDLSGFTDYDNSLLEGVCNNKNTPNDLSFFYVNSKDTTLIDALNKIFLPYQIVAYIDEYGVMKFSTLSDMLDSSVTNITINDSSVLENGYSVTNKAKPGKISIRYELPKIKQSAALQNLQLAEASPSFVYTTSNEVVWSQQNSDSIGMNYLASSMGSFENYFEMDNNDLLDIFHTYNLNYQGYAAIENEIVSFEYKEYDLSSTTIREDLIPENPVTVSVKNDLELDAEITRYTKKYQVGLPTSEGQERPVSSVLVTPTGKITKVKRGMFGSKASEHTVLSSSNASSKNLTCKQISTLDNSISDGTTSTTANNEFLVATPANSKVVLYPTTERSVVATPSGSDYYKTYSVKIRLVDGADKCSGGLVFNLGVGQNVAISGSYFLELVKYNTFKPDQTTPNSPKKYNYILVFYTITAGQPDIIAYTDVTTAVKNIIKNTEKVLEKITVNGETQYQVKSDPRYEYFHLKAVTYKSTGNLTGIGPDGPYTYNDGESTSITNLLSVFLNNIEIKGWRKYIDDPVLGTGWVPLDRNENTKLPKKIQYTNSISPGSIFGAFLSSDPVMIPGITYITGTPPTHAGSVREIYATHKPLKERSVNYYFQSREFLNGIVQNQNILSTSKSYMMQTKPEVIGINTYDVQYTTPAAVTVDVWPIEYLIKYFPGTGPIEQKYMRSKEVDEYSLSYSSILNTGFRAKFAIANNTSHMVYLKKDADQSKQTNVKLNLWTHEIIANSDPDIIEKIIDPGNASESVQIDSNWIQSKESAKKILSIITNGIEYFSKDISLDIFGNPLLQVGDKVQLTYPLAGINQQVYIITSISHDFNEGLSTRLGLNMISPGVSY